MLAGRWLRMYPVFHKGCVWFLHFYLIPKYLFTFRMSLVKVRVNIIYPKVLSLFGQEDGQCCHFTKVKDHFQYLSVQLISNRNIYETFFFKSKVKLLKIDDFIVFWCFDVYVFKEKNHNVFFLSILAPPYSWFLPKCRAEQLPNSSWCCHVQILSLYSSFLGKRNRIHKLSATNKQVYKHNYNTLE